MSNSISTGYKKRNDCAYLSIKDTVDKDCPEVENIDRYMSFILEYCLLYKVRPV